MSVVPYLTITGGRATEGAAFYTKLFGAKETMRMPAEDKKRLMHCALEFGGNFVYLADDFENRGGQPALTSIFVGLDTPAAVDALVNTARGMGATGTNEPADMFWGDRFGTFTDPFGHRWQVGARKG